LGGSKKHTQSHKTLKGVGSPSKSKKRQAAKNDADANAPQNQRKGLSSPTSISMKNTFLIKNADPSFDIYYTAMKKRKAMQAGGHTE
jgi:hypothetical protein